MNDNTHANATPGPPVGAPPPSAEELRQGRNARRTIIAVAVAFILLSGAGAWLAMKSGG